MKMIAFKNLESNWCWIPRDSQISVITGLRAMDKQGRPVLGVAPGAMVVLPGVQVFVTLATATAIVKLIAANVTTIQDPAK